jgi:hypothetical protein
LEAAKETPRRFVVLFLVVALVRLALLLASQHHANGDDAAIGVMAQRIVAGERPLHPSVADRHAGSALAGYLAAGVFAVFGSSELALKVPPLVWSLAALAGVYFLVRSVRGPDAALLVAALYATSVGLMKWSFYSAGGYIVCQALFCLAFWLLLARTTVPERSRPRHDLLLGWLCGAGTAILVLFAPAAASAGLFLLLAGKSGSPWTRSARFAGAFVVGSAPLWLFIRDVDQNPPSALLENLGALPGNLWEVVTRHLPAALAYDNIEGAPTVQLVPNGIAYAVLLAGWGFLLAYRGPAVAAFVHGLGSGRATGELPIEAPLAFYVAAYLVLYATHPFAGEEARHLLPLEPALTILAGLGLAEALARRRSAPAAAWGAALLVGLALGNAALQHARLLGDPRILGPRGPVDQRTAREVATLLGERDVRGLVTDDWDLSWRVSFLTQGRIAACHGVAEHAGWAAGGAEDAHGRFAFVVGAGSQRDRVLSRRADRTEAAGERALVRDKAVHLRGLGEPASELPPDWCPPERLLEPLSLERVRAIDRR